MNEINEESVSFHDYIDIIYRKKWLIVMVFVSVFLTTLYFVHREPQRYHSQATIYLEYAGNIVTPAFVSLGTGGGKPSTLRPLEFYLGIFDSRSFKNQIHRELVSYATRLGLTESEARGRATEALKTLEIKARPHKGYYSISVQASSPDLAFAADSIAIRLFAERCRQVSQQENNAMVVFMASQLDSARRNLLRAEDALQDFNRRHNLVRLETEEGAQSTPIEYSRLTTSYYNAREERQAAEATLQAMRQTVALLEQTYDSLALDPVRRARPAEEWADVQERLRKAVTELQIKEYQEKSLERQLREYELAHPELPTISLNLARLTRERDLYQRLQSILMERREELRMESSSESGGVKIIDPPTSGSPVPSRARVSLIVGVVVGLVFGVGVAFFWEFMDSNVKSTTDLARILDVSTIAAIPSIGASRKKKSNGTRRRHSRASLITEGSLKDPVAEAYRSLRTTLMYSAGDHRLKTLVVSSAGQAEGKSVTTANLGITCAQMGQRTVIIDGDLRRPVQHMNFGLERDGGMSEYLLRDLELADVAKPSGVDNLDIITAGITPPNPAPLIGSKAFAERLAELHENYELVLIDSPPIIAVTDAVLLGRVSDGVLMVVRCAATPRAAVKHAFSILDNAKVNVLGAVLNDVDVSRHYGGYYYYNYYYHYYYGGYYGADSDKREKAEKTSS